MSEANIEIVRALWDSIEAVDGATVDWDSEPIRELFEARFAPDLELRWAASGPDPTVYRGSEGGDQSVRGVGGAVTSTRPWRRP